MKTVAICGWEVGFQKVRFTELLKGELGYSLSDAKAATDAVLENRRFEIRLRDELFDRVVRELLELGVKVEL